MVKSLQKHHYVCIATRRLHKIILIYLRLPLMVMRKSYILDWILIKKCSLCTGVPNIIEFWLMLCFYTRRLFRKLRKNLGAFGSV